LNDGMAPSHDTLDLPRMRFMWGFSFHDAQPVTLLKPFNCSRKLLGVQHSDQAALRKIVD
jgi:hypothetical protein